MSEKSDEEFARQLADRMSTPKPETEAESNEAAEHWSVAIRLRRDAEDRLIAATEAGEPASHIAAELNRVLAYEEAGKMAWRDAALPDPMAALFGTQPKGES